MLRASRLLIITYKPNGEDIRDPKQKATNKMVVMSVWRNVSWSLTKRFKKFLSKMKLTSSLYLDADVDILGRISWQTPSDRIVDIRKCYLHERTSLERKLEFERLRATTELMSGTVTLSKKGGPKTPNGTILFKKPWKDRLEEIANIKDP
jgi:hypothetical protein